MLHNADTPRVSPRATGTTGQPDAAETTQASGAASNREARESKDYTKGGPGQSFASHEAALRQAILGVITPQVIRAILASMMAAALDGNQEAAELLRDVVRGRVRR
jgi:hypothetical protein